MPKNSKKLPPRIALKPNKLLGQNFLRDKNILRKIIAAANLSKDDLVLEVGPGEGTLTEELAQVAGRVIAVEKDRTLAAQLKIKFAGTKNVEIVEGDILEFLKTKNYQLPTNFKVVANIPYYLTSHLIRLLLESANPPQDMILMIQKEVAERICACPPEPEGRRGAKPPRLRQGFGGQAKMSLLAVSVQFYAEPKIIAKVSKNAFWPKPKVDSAIIRITPRPVASEASSTGPHAKYQNIEISKYFQILHAGFSHPRKQLLNNLSAGLKIPRDKIIKVLSAAGLKPDQRAETLSVEDWIELSSLL